MMLLLKNGYLNERYYYNFSIFREVDGVNSIQDHLFAVGVIDYVIPFSYIITFALFVGLFGGYGFNWSYISAHLAGGGLMLGAFFMATDYVTCPITPKGRYIYGIILGLLTGLFRTFGANAEGVSYAIIIGNLLVPLIEKVTIPKAFGIRKKAKKEANKA